MHNYMGMPNVKFIVARPFDTEYGHHDVGEEFKEARAMYNLDVLVSAGFVYPYSTEPADGYNYLPPHLFSIVMTRQEAEEKLEGDPSGLRGVAQHPESPKPEVQLQAEREAEMQERFYPEILKLTAERQRRNLAAAQPEGDYANPSPTPAVPADKQEELAKEEEKEHAKAAKEDAPAKTPAKKTAAPVRKTAVKKTAATNK